MNPTQKVSQYVSQDTLFLTRAPIISDLSKAEELSQKLAAGLPAHITSQSFPWQVLVQIVAINVFAMNHVHQHTDDRMNQNGLSASEEEMTDEEEICFNLVFALTGTYHVYFHKLSCSYKCTSSILLVVITYGIY